MKKIWTILLVIVALACLIVGRDFLTHSGTFFLLDNVNFPISSMSLGFFQTTFYRFINDFLTLILGYVLFSKLRFFAILFFSGLLGFLFTQRGSKLLGIEPKYAKITEIGTIFFMMINPFLYERMITQPGIYLAILLLGYGLYFLLKNISTARMKHYLFAGIFRGFAVTLSPHTIFMIGIILLTYAGLFARDKKDFGYLGILVGIVLLLNLNWILGGFLRGESSIISAVGTFSQANINNFLSNGLRPLGAEATNLLLYGFWGERFGHLHLPISTYGSWFFYGRSVFLLVCLGWYRVFLKQKKLAFFLVIVGIVAWICGVGNASHLWGQGTQWLYDNVPYYVGLREPQKWIGLLMLVYALGFGIGIAYLYAFLSKLLRSPKQWIVSVLFLAVVLGILNGWSPNVLGGFRGQLFMTDYPSELDVYRQYYIQDNRSYLVLPWHSYIACDWTQGRIIGNLMNRYFEPGNVLVADNLEIGSLYSNSTSQRSKDIETFLKTKDIDLLKKWGIQTILFLDKCADFPVYKFLDTQPSLKRSYSTFHLKAYDISYEK